MYYARSRAGRRLGEAIAAATVSGTVTVAAAAVAGARWGLEAMAVAWVLAQSLAAGWALWRLHGMRRDRVGRRLEPPKAFPAAAQDNA
jgi:O-antigen/teichoic acid export membrane protein